MKIYRVTPKNGKFIIQRVSDRKTIKVEGSPFINETAAHTALQQLLLSSNPNNKSKPGMSFLEAFKKFAQMKLDLKNETNRVTHGALQRYMRTYDLRLKPYLDPTVLLTDFRLDQMEAFLKKAYDDGVAFKTLRNAVKDIKHFIRQANKRGWNACRDMEDFSIYDYHYVVPKDDSLILKKPTNVLSQEVCFKLIMNAYNKWKASKNLDRDSANRFAIFSLMFMFGMRPSEMQGLKRSKVNLEARTLTIDAAWIPAEGGYVERLKNIASRRTLKLDDDNVKFFKIWFYYLDGSEKNNDFVLPACREKGPLSYKYILAQVWRGYAEEGLAEITTKRDGHVVIHSSPLKGHPLKTFRHRFCTKLMRCLKDQDMDQNEVKGQAGHAKFTTTSEIYGDHLVDISEDDQKRIARARGKALGTSIFSQIIEN